MVYSTLIRLEYIVFRIPLMRDTNSMEFPVLIPIRQVEVSECQFSERIKPQELLRIQLMCINMIQRKNELHLFCRFLSLFFRGLDLFSVKNCKWKYVLVFVVSSGLLFQMWFHFPLLHPAEGAPSLPYRSCLSKIKGYTTAN